MLDEVTNDKGNITKGALKVRIKALKKVKDPEFADELAVLNEYFDLSERESAIKKKFGDVDKVFAKKYFVKYAQLNADEVKALVVHDKWFAVINVVFDVEVERVF